jgi:CBS domain-containing protein
MPRGAQKERPEGDYVRPSLSDATVSDAMYPGIIACPEDAPLRIVAKAMAAGRVHCVAVVGGADPDGGPSVLGIVSDLGLVRAALDRGFGMTAAELAIDPVVTVDASMPLREAGALMVSDDVQHLVVTAPGSKRPIGVLSSLDLTATIAWGGE